MATAELAEAEALQTLSEATKPDQQKPFDPYFYRAEMPFHGDYHPLGFPVRITTNSLAVLESAQESWGRYEPRFSIDPIRLQIGVQADGGKECPGRLVPRAHQHMMIGIADAANYFVADLLQGVSFAWVTTAAAEHPLYLRSHVLESAALSHIANRHTAPVHAACVAHEGRGVLLCGDSGVGKSTLAFACARAGWTYVSDDAAFLVHGRSDRQAIGHCHSIRLRPAAAGLFAEIHGRPHTPRMRGKPSIEIATSELPGLRTTLQSDIDFVVFLNRSDDGAQELAPYPREMARRYLQKHLNGWEPLRREQVASVERLLSARVHGLRYRDLGWAIERLTRMVREES